MSEQSSQGLTWVAGVACATAAAFAAVPGCSQGAASQEGPDLSTSPDNAAAGTEATSAGRGGSSGGRGGGSSSSGSSSGSTDGSTSASDPGPRGGAAAAGAPATPQPIDPDSSSAKSAASVACFPGLSATNLAACEQAVIRLQEVDSVHGTVGTESGLGLGPTFNGNSCATCHSQPAVLGSSPGMASPQNPVPNPQIALATLDGAKNTVPSFLTAAGPVREVRFQSDNGVHDLFTIAGRSDASGCNATQPNFGANAISFRIPTPLFGLGLVENTPDATLQSNLTNSSAQFDTGGTFNTSGNDGTITRFGWKAQNKSILIFVEEAYNVEQGVTSEGFPNERSGGAGNTQGCLGLNPTPEDITNLGGSGDNTVSDVSSDTLNFALAVRLSKAAAPATAPFTIGETTITANELTEGSNQFVNAGCASCHTPSLTTAAASFDPAMSNVTFHPYSDFAIHHMGSGLADGITQGNAGSDQFRTAPLWGVGQRLFFLHDGRTSSLTAAIEAHAGDAATVIANFNKLSESDQQDIIYFLRSL
jgi:CxxC motif-containing protein (DUF1111 family)